MVEALGRLFVRQLVSVLHDRGARMERVVHARDESGQVSPVVLLLSDFVVELGLEPELLQDMGRRTAQPCVSSASPDSWSGSGSSLRSSCFWLSSSRGTEQAAQGAKGPNLDVGSSG